MVNKFSLSQIIALLLLGLACFTPSYGQTIMFDDFTYSGVNDSQLSSFNKWSIVDGRSGPPEGAMYSRNNIAFVNDPANASNKLMTVSTTVNGTTRAVTNSRIETGGFEYFTGTYAARVYLTDLPNTYSDGNIQTFFTIVSSALAGDGTKYSELDIVEYMASDKWGLSPNNPVLYTTSYHKYKAVPWEPYKTYFHSDRSWAGWHTFIASCTDGVNVKYWIDDLYLGAQSVTDAETKAGLPVYPRSPMQVAFANWIVSEGGATQIGGSKDNRTTTMQVDWTLFVKDQEKSLSQINSLVNGYKTQGLQRRNLAGQTFVTTPCTAAAQPGPIQGNMSVAAGSSQTYSVAPVAGATSYTWALPSGWTGTSSSASINTTAGSAGGTISVKANNTCGSSAATTASVSLTTPTGQPVPGTIQAESYAAMSGVETEGTTDAGGGRNVDWFETNDWVEYAVNVQTAGTYAVGFRVASGASTVAQLQLRTSGGSVLGSVSVENTGGWQNWVTRTATVTLPAGVQTLRVFAAASTGCNLNWLSFATGSTPPPSSSITIQAEAYNSMGGVQVENTADTGGGQNVGWIDATDWMSYYNINFPTSGAYLIEYRVASVNGSTLAADLNGGAIPLGSVSIPATGGWQNWRTVSHTVNINAGTYNFGLYAPASGWNINWVRITKATASRTAGSSAATKTGGQALALYPNPATSQLTLQAAEAFVGGQVRIRDAAGRQVWSAPYQGQAVPVAGLKAGLYLLELSHAGITNRLRFVKQ